MLKGLIEEKEDDQKYEQYNNNKHNYQQPNLKKQKQTKQTSRTGTESQKWRSRGGLSAGRGREEDGGKGTGNKPKW